MQTPELALLEGAAGAEMDGDEAKAAPMSAATGIARKTMIFPLPFFDPTPAVEAKRVSGSSPE